MVQRLIERFSRWFISKSGFTTATPINFLTAAQIRKLLLSLIAQL